MAFQKERQINAKLQGRKRLISIYFYDSKTNIKREWKRGFMWEDMRQCYLACEEENVTYKKRDEK